jgi:hypothetical protein
MAVVEIREAEITFRLPVYCLVTFHLLHVFGVTKGVTD